MKRLLVIGFVTILCLSACYMLKNELMALACADSITISPALLDFGDQPAWSTSVEQPVVISFPGGCSAELTDLFLGKTGSDSGQYKIDRGTCGSTLATGTTCTATISFSPKGVGDLNNASFTASAIGGATVSDNIPLSGTGTEPEPGTVLLFSQLGSQGESDGCNANASTGAAGVTSSGPAAFGLIALMGLVLGAVTVRRRMRKRS